MPESKFVAAGGLRIHYLEEGSGVPLVCLHGGPAAAELTWGEIGPLADSYRIIAPDSRGHGQTDNPEGTLSYAQMADDVAALIEVLGLERPLVFGYSDGGQIALELGLRHPGKTRALVLGAVVTGMSAAARAGLERWGIRASGEIDHAVLEQSWGAYYRALPAIHDYGKGPDHWRVLLGLVAGMWHSVPSYSDAQLVGIVEPALVICGDHDEVGAIEAAPHLFSLLPRGELAVVPNADHGAVQSSPLFWSAVRDFLARYSGSSP